MCLVTIREIHSGDILDIVAAKIVLVRRSQSDGTIIQMDDGQRIHTSENTKVVGARLALALRKINGDGTA